MAIEDYITQATTEIEALKPLHKDNNGVVLELSDDEYTEEINKRAAFLDVENEGYK
tara:strand:+ start:35 stop:202 length:168 start_codon:yes stop_codon:yes gene_type:complete